MKGNYTFLGVFALIILVFAYEEYEGQQRENAFFTKSDGQQRVSEGLKKLNEIGTTSDVPENTAYPEGNDFNVLINYPFGVSIPIVAGLKRLPGASQNCYAFVDAQTESRNDILVVAPTAEDLTTIAQNLQAAGTPFTRTENTVTASISTNGLTMNMSYNVSPNGGGVSIMRWITGTPVISQHAIDALFNGIRFRQATASLAERQQLLETDIQNQRAYNARQTEQQQIENLKRQRVLQHGMHELNDIAPIY